MKSHISAANLQFKSSGIGNFLWVHADMVGVSSTSVEAGTVTEDKVILCMALSLHLHQTYGYYSTLQCSWISSTIFSCLYFTF